METGPTLRVAAGCLFAHVIVVYLVKSLVLSRYLHSITSPNDLDADTAISYLKNASWGCGMLVFGYIVANVFPFFYQLMGLIGGLLAAPINFLVPIALYLTAIGRSQHPQVPRMSTSKSNASMWSSGSFGWPEEEKPTVIANMCAGASALPLGEKLLVLFTVALICGVSTVGVYSQALAIIDSWKSLGAPFTCHAL